MNLKQAARRVNFSREKTKTTDRTWMQKIMVDNGKTCVATDGKRMAICPVEGVDPAWKGMRTVDGEPGYRVRWRDVMPPPGQSCSFKRAEVLPILEQVQEAAKRASRRDKPVWAKLTKKEGIFEIRLELDQDNPYSGPERWSLPWSHTGDFPDIALGFTPRYLREAVRATEDPCFNLVLARGEPYSLDGVVARAFMITQNNDPLISIIMPVAPKEMLRAARVRKAIRGR